MDFATYILLSQLGITVLYLLYKFLFSSDTFLQAHRITLLCGVVFAYLYPLAYYQPIHTHISGMYDQYSLELPMIIVPVESTTDTFDIFSLYWIGVIIGASFFLFRLASLVYISMRSTTVVINGVKVYNPNVDIKPFSFASAIFINVNKYDDNLLYDILLHEKAHVEGVHTLDLVLSEFVAIVGWFNPIAWLLRHEIRINVECLADKEAVKHTPSVKGYQYHLLHIVRENVSINSIGMHFNHKMLKQRVKKLNQADSHFVRRIIYFIMLPASIFMFFVASAWPLSIERPILDMTANDIVVENLPVNDEVPEDNPVLADNSLPQFPGGDASLMRFISNNIKYPQEAIRDNIQGVVMVKFVINSDGYIVNPTIMRGLSPECDNEVLRLVSIMPKWQPGRNAGVNVETNFVLPVSFVMQ